MAPEGSEHLFSEKLWKLDIHCEVWDPGKNDIGQVNNLPALRNGFITFGTLTRTIRINDRVIKTWADILSKVPNAKLIINSKCFKNLIVYFIIFFSSLDYLIIANFPTNSLPSPVVDSTW